MDCHSRRIRASLAASSATRVRDGRTLRQDEEEFEQALEQKLAVLEAVPASITAADVGTTDAGRLEAARAVCEAVEGLIEGRGWRS